MKLRVFVTGSSGFIGRELVALLEAQGNEIVGFSRGDGKDIRNAGLLEQAMQGCDAVVHLAAELDEGSRELFSINVDGTRSVVETAARMRIGHFVFISTTGVLGNFSGIADESFPYNPATPYEKSKAEAEKLVLSYQEVMPVTVLRPTIVVGPNEYWKKIISMVGNNYPLIGDGGNYWQTLYYKDLCDAIATVLGNEECFGEIYNVGEPKPRKLREIVEIIRKETGVRGKLVTVPVFIGKIAGYVLAAFSKISGSKEMVNPSHIERMLRNRIYSTKKIEALGWKSSMTTESSIRETILEIQKIKKI